MAASPEFAPRPAHVPPGLVVDFDMYDVPGGDVDAQLAYHAFQQSCPGLFWTPRNGGHWVATLAEDVEAILRDPKHFSSARVFLPRDDKAPRSLPLETDAPLHVELRKPLNRALFPRIIDAMEPEIRNLTVALIDGLLPRDGCDFVADFAKIMPMCIFLDLVDLPREERQHLLPLVEQFIKGGTTESRTAAQLKVFDYIRATVRARRAAPGTDLASIVVNCEMNGEMISEDDATAYLTLVLFGGLDTIASMLSYIVHFLAQHPVERAQLAGRLDDDKFIRNAIEELFRRFGIVNAGRVVVEDIHYKDVFFRSDDTILPINMLYGLDESLVANPMVVDFNREKPARHLVFGAGPHSCPGATLARREIAIFLQEWLARVPDFSLAPGSQIRNVTGVTCSLETLPLTWPARP